MKKICIVCLLLLLPAIAMAQEVLWTENGYRLAAVSDNGDRLIFEQVTQEEDGMVSNVGAKVICIGGDGEAKWTRVIDGDGTDKLEQALALADGWLAVGSSSSSDLGGAWHAGWYDAKEPKTDGWAVRFDLDGNVLWSRNYGGSDWDSFHAACPAEDGGWLLVGNTYSQDGDVEGWHDSGELFTQPDGWTVRIDEAGELVWQSALGGSGYDIFMGVQPVSAGYMIAGIAGSSDGDVSSPLGAEGDRDAWIVLLDAEGALVREICYGGKGEDEFVALAEGPDGPLAVGTSWSFGAGEDNRDESAWAMCLDEQGDELWRVRFGGEGFEYPQHAAWVSDFWAISGVTPKEAGPVEWIVAIPREGGDWKLIRGEL